MKPYVYIVIRKDINPVNYAPQIAHAALESGYQSEEPDTTTHIVVLEVDNKHELEMVCYGLQGEEVMYEEFHESFGNMGLTSLATLPTKKLTDSILCQLDLFRYETDDKNLDIKQDPRGWYYLAGLPFLEDDAVANMFDTKEEARQYYIDKFSDNTS